MCAKYALHGSFQGRQLCKIEENSNWKKCEGKVLVGKEVLAAEVIIDLLGKDLKEHNERQTFPTDGFLCDCSGLVLPSPNT